MSFTASRIVGWSAHILEQAALVDLGQTRQSAPHPPHTVVARRVLSAAGHTVDNAMKAVPPVLALLAVAPPAQETLLPEGRDRVVVPLRHLDRGRPGWLVGIDVEIAGAKTTFVLDTGAGQNVIDRDLAVQFEMKTVMKVDVHSAAGSKPGELVALPPVAFGGMTYEAQVGVRLRLRGRLGKHTVPVGGILGTPFFARYPVTFDLDNDTFTIHDPDAFEPPERAHEIKLESFGMTPTIRVKLGEQKPVRMMVDTGCGLGLLLYPHHVERLGLLEEPHDYHETKSGSGSERTVMFTAMLERAAIGSLALRDVSIGLFAQADDRGLTGDRTRAGMIGGGVIWRFNSTFDYRRKRLYLRERLRKPGPWSLDYGISLRPRGDDAVDVGLLLDDSPAARAGIQRGDVVIKIDGWSVGRDINGANRRLRKTTRASLTVRRDGASKVVELARKPVLVPMRWPR